nr:MAG TPA: hypothetical protein [Crassvirales sp.]
MKRINKGAAVMMAVAGGRESTENTRKFYLGVGAVYVTAVNPNMAQLNAFYGSDNVTEEPVYIGETEVGEDKVKTPQVKIDFLVITDPAKNNGIEMKTKISFYIVDAFRYNKDKTKVQVVDKYGQFAWPTLEEARAHAIPQYANGPANLDKDYRPAFIGEEFLTDFIKKYLNIPSPSYSYTDKNTGEQITKTLPNLDDALARLDNIKDYFKGDFKELENVLKLQPSNLVKAAFGVKTTDDNKMYQTVYTQKFLKNVVTDYSKLDEEIQSRKENGAYATTEFSVEPLHEYKVESTDFSAPANDLPFGAPSAPAQGGAAPAGNVPWPWAK